MPGLSIRANGSSLSLVLIKRIAHVRAGGWPSEASVKVFGAPFFKKARPCPYRRSAGKETRETGALPRLSRPVAPCPLSHGCRRASVSAAASVGRWATSHRDVAAPKGEPSRCATKSLQKAKSCLPLWGALVPSGDRPGPTEPAGETLAAARAHQENSARARRGRVALPHPFQTEKRTSKLFRVSFLFGAKKIVPFHFSSGRRCAIVSL